MELRFFIFSWLPLCRGGSNQKGLTTDCYLTHKLSYGSHAFSSFNAFFRLASGEGGESLLPYYNFFFYTATLKFKERAEVSKKLTTFEKETGKKNIPTDKRLRSPVCSEAGVRKKEGLQREREEKKRRKRGKRE